MTLDSPQIAYVDPYGVEWFLGIEALDAIGMTATTGVTGLGLPPRTITADPNPRGGTSPRHVQKGPRTVILPVLIEGADHSTFLGRFRGLAEAMDATDTAGPGWLVVYRPDGSRRLTPCYYEAGFDHDPDLTATTDLVVLQMYCPSPWWQAPDPIVIPRSGGSAAVSFLSPFFRLTNTQIFGSTTATNPGGITAWPTWTITGPTTFVTATNNTTGESFTFNPVGFRGSGLAAGEVLTITTDPPTITGPAGGPNGTNWSGSLNWPGAILWGLRKGDNAITYTVSGGSSATAVDLSFYPRWATA